MLSPSYLAGLPDDALELVAQAEADILADMARRISAYNYWIPAAEWQRRKLIEMGAVQGDILRRLSKLTGKSTKELKLLMRRAGIEALGTDSAIYRNAGLSPPTLAASKPLQAVVNAGLLQTGGLLRNFTRTTASAAAGQFSAALDRAWLQINSGAFDSNTAIRNAVKDLSRQGLHAIRYPTGHADTLEVAVRRAVVTGVNQTALKSQLALAEAMGCDLVEVSAHGGARPEHAAWQGKVFSLSGKSDKYGDFRRETGYGTGAGLGGWNCRHSFSPYFEGSPRAYTPKMLQGMEDKRFCYKGRSMTEAEAQSQQRYLERQIRRWKRENMAMKAAGQDTAESAAKIAQWQRTQAGYLRHTGLKRQSDREQIAR